jgi:hypothetical protein
MNKTERREFLAEVIADYCLPESAKAKLRGNTQEALRAEALAMSRQLRGIGKVRYEGPQAVPPATPAKTAAGANRIVVKPPAKPASPASETAQLRAELKRVTAENTALKAQLLSFITEEEARKRAAAERQERHARIVHQQREWAAQEAARRF